MTPVLRTVPRYDTVVLYMVCPKKTARRGELETHTLARARAHTHTHMSYYTRNIEIKCTSSYATHTFLMRIYLWRCYFYFYGLTFKRSLTCCERINCLASFSGIPFEACALSFFMITFSAVRTLDVAKVSFCGN